MSGTFHLLNTGMTQLSQVRRAIARDVGLDVGMVRVPESPKGQIQGV
jgi:hypothetical protein